MKYAVTLNEYSNLDCYGKVLHHFERKFLNTNQIYEDAENWFHNLGKYMDNTKFPCDKIVLDPFCGYSDIFMLLFKYKNQDICYMKVKVHPNGMMSIHNYGYHKKDFEMFHNIIVDYFKQINKGILINVAAVAEISLTNDDNAVVVEFYKDYKKVDGKTDILKGTIQSIFSKYETYNDRYKYCNGTYIKFADSRIESLWRAFLTDYDGNFFLDNAIKRGCIID